ncbi:hypothetical protein [Acidiphilium sp. PA]|nr:hypothetical protein [Acidiphilium sp. PA]
MAPDVVVVGMALTALRVQYRGEERKGKGFGMGRSLTRHELPLF